MYFWASALLILLASAPVRCESPASSQDSAQQANARQQGDSQRRQKAPEPILVPAINPPHRPIRPPERAIWLVKSTIGLQSHATGVVSAAWRTALDKPSEYPGTWGGFGKRFGMRFTGVATSNAMEAGLGALWDEDPRYVRAPDDTLGERIRRPIRLTFLAYSSEGALRPAYARYVAVGASSFVSNAWRVPSDSSAKDAIVRVGLGFLGRMAGNAFSEFWPDLKHRRGRPKPKKP